jgi:2-dehydropantoate 2-reductase
VTVTVTGAGAIGGYIGARLTRAGADVVLFARGPHLLAMQERGLRVISPDGDFEVKPHVVGDLNDIGRADVVVLGVKAHGLTTLAPLLRPLFHADTVVVSTQNGIPWWYFQGIGGELDGLRLERVDPGVARLAGEPVEPVQAGLEAERDQLAGEGDRALAQLAFIDDGVDQAHFQALLGRHVLAGRHHLQRLFDADDARQALRSAGATTPTSGVLP